jgi:hypothetical protein
LEAFHPMVEGGLGGRIGAFIQPLRGWTVQAYGEVETLRDPFRAWIAVRRTF